MASIGISRRSKTLLAAALLLGALTPPAGAAQSDADPPSSPAELSVELEFTVWPTEGGRSAPALRAEELAVSFDGRPQKVVSVGPAAAGSRRTGDSWRVVVYADPALSTPEGLRAAAAALSGELDRLRALGSLEIVVADPFTETFAFPDDSAQDVRAALAELADLADGAGEILALRQEDLSGDEALAEEMELLRERQLELLRWLAAQPGGGPSCLLLLQDGFDLELMVPGGSPEADSERRAAAGSALTESQRTLAAVLAIGGWTVVPVAPDSAATPLLPGRSEALSQLAEATGGEVVTDAAELGGTLDRLAAAGRVRARLSGRPDGLPRRLEITGSVTGPTLHYPRWAALTTPLVLSELRAWEMLEEGEPGRGELRTAAVIRPEPAAEASPDGLPGLVEALVTLPSTLSEAPLFRVSLLLVETGGARDLGHELADPGNLAGAAAWLYRRGVALTEELAGGAVVVEELRSRRWGAASLELAERGPTRPGGRVAEWSSPNLRRAPAATAPPALSVRGVDEAIVIRLLPPRRRPATGETRFQTLVSSPLIERTEFLLDGELAASDDRAPFSASLDLGTEVRTHTVQVVAYTADGVRLGAHEITVNPSDDSFQVRIADISSPLGGLLEVEAEVRVPRDARLDRVELYWNEALVETFHQGPFRIELPAPDEGAQDFVRAVAYLADGTWIDDARLLGAGGISERVEVNLVEVHVVITDRDDKPVRDLAIEDFTVEVGGQARPIERLSLAEEVPLVLGVVIDTSESMWPLMLDTQKAGAQFVANSLREGDSAFLVDFDTRPRLAHDTTTDLMALLKTFNRLTPDGFTALYDAVIFSMLQFEEAVGRKALVLLTDGDDYRSRYGPRRCIQYGRQLGVPVYIISLAGIQNPRRNLRRIDLEGITEGTGGRVYYITEMSQLAEAYAAINEELRSQFILTFSTDRPLGQDELDAIDVQVAGKGLAVRGVVGGQRVE